MSTEEKKKLAPEAETQLQEQYVQSLQPIEEGQMIPGRVIEVDDDYVYVDVGYKSEGKIPANEFDAKPADGRNGLRHPRAQGRPRRPGHRLQAQGGREDLLEGPADRLRRAQAGAGHHRPQDQGRLRGGPRQRHPRLPAPVQGGREAAERELRLRRRQVLVLHRPPLRQGQDEHRRVPPRLDGRGHHASAARSSSAR